MKTEFIVLVLIIFISNHQSYGQVLNCDFLFYNTLYTCNLTIVNPNGLNNFTGISGTHLTGMTDNDIERIYSPTGSNSTNVPSIICEKFKNVEYIYLLSMGIKKIDEHSFKNCKILFYLDLGFNQIDTIDEKSFSENTELHYLYLLYNELTSLPENVFLNQQKLVTLWFDYNRISNPPKNVFDPLENLRELDLRGNQIKNLKVRWFEKLENLKNLYLVSNQIEELPKNVFSPLKNMDLLDLYNNKLKTIHANSFGILPNLTTINMMFNFIDAVDERFIDNTGVISLNMQNNNCANVFIFDDSTSRETMRNDLQNCFNNYNILYPGIFSFCLIFF